MNVSINMSIIKHNEFRSQSFKDGAQDIGMESEGVPAPHMGQEYQTIISDVERSQRRIFLESINEFVEANQFQDQSVKTYA